MQNRSQRGATNDLFDVWMKKCHSLILSREGLILTLSILPCPEGWISWSIPVDGLMMRRMSVLHQNSGGIGKSIPSALEISLNPRDFPQASPSGNLSGLGKSLGRRGWISQYLPRFGGARIHCNALWSLISLATVLTFNWQMSAAASFHISC